MSSGGWQFSVTVPSWTQASLEGDENIVFYRVEVKVLPPEADAAPRTRSVLRRFNHFTKLYQRLKEELGNKKMAKLEPPSKNRLGSVNKRPDLVEKRRRELESWLWKLIGDGEIARSQVLNKFLELSDAARLVQRPMPPPQASRPQSQSGSYAWSEGGGSSVHDGSQPSAAASFHSTSQHAPAGFEVLPGHGLPPMHRSVSDASQLPSTSQPPSESPSQPMTRSTSAGVAPSDPGTASADHMRHTAASEAGEPQAGGVGFQVGGLRAEQVEWGEPHMRLGLRMHQRFAVQQHVKELQRQLDTAAGDVQDAMEAIFTERRNKRELAAQLADLHARASEDGILQAVAAQADLEQRLQQQQEAASQLQSDLDESRAAAALLEQQLFTAQQQLETSEQALDKEQQASAKLQCDVGERDLRIQDLDQKLEREHRQTADANSQIEDSGLALSNERNASMHLQQALKRAQQEVRTLEQQSMQHQSAAAQAQAQANESQQAVADEQDFSARLRQELSAAQSQAQDLTTQLTQNESELDNSAQQLHASQQAVESLEAELQTVRQKLSHANQMQHPSQVARSASASVDRETNDEAAPSATGQDEPSVAPPQEGAVPNSSLHSREAEAERGPTDAKVAALHAELAAYKQEVAAADTKARADRKLLAKEVKNLRKQLQEQKQQTAVRPDAQQDASTPATETAAPVLLHIHVTTAAAAPSVAATSSTAQSSAHALPDTQAEVPQDASRLSAGPGAETGDPAESLGPVTETEAPGLRSADDQAEPSAAVKAEASQFVTPGTAMESSETSQPASSVDEGQQSSNGDVLSNVTPDKPLDLLTGSFEGGEGTPSELQLSPPTMDLLGIHHDSSGPPAAAQSSASIQQPHADALQLDPFSGAQPASSAGADATLPTVHPTDATADLQPTNSSPAGMSLDLLMSSTASMQAEPASQSPTATDSCAISASATGSAQAAESSTQPESEVADGQADEQSPTATDQDHAVSATESAQAAESLTRPEFEVAGAESSTQPESEVANGQGDEQSAQHYKQLLQEVSALRKRLHDCSVETLEGQADSRNLTPQQSMELLATCDRRLQALMAEADLLGQPVLSGSNSTAEAAFEAELRQAFASILIESGSLRQQINALLRDKYEWHSKDAQRQQAAADAGGLFQKFRPPGMSFLNSQTNGGNSQAGSEDAAHRPAFSQAIGDRFAGFGDRFSKSFRPQQ